ncbi:helix-turn-helix domain-containing protein [Dermatobacter hominis]|uniref:helix-turn-helix domain-containing protein n=1 Tax=Dermatobacter hominis TaxID=2884263 RepID=UPI001D120CBB|nr:helix-turn-helix transcriptional regulator [Dermatobacter hominis]UDY35329.1 helix-turn-helix transcriptional regulator [Dermatobacter hominis]
MDTLTTGPTMRRARELAGMGRADAAQRVGVGRRELRGIERGRCAPTPEVLDRALAAYGGDELELPPRQDLVHPTDPHLLVVGDDLVRVDPFRDDDAQVLVDYVAAVRRQRRLGRDAEVRFRSHDLVQLATVLDLTAGDLERRLAAVTGTGDAAARRAARLLVLTGLAMALAGARAVPDVVVPDAPWVLPQTDRRLFDVTARTAPAAAPLFSTAERGGTVVHDGSWLARDGSRPTFTTVPSVRLEAIAELVAQCEPVSAAAEHPALPAPGRRPA